MKKTSEGTDPFGIAIAHWQSLDRKYKDDKEIPTGLANAYLWSASRAANATDKAEAYTNALKNYQRAMKNPMDGPDSFATIGKIEQGFIDAASGAPTVDAEQATLAHAIVTRRLASPTPNAVEAARLAWILSKTSDAEARKDGVALLKKVADTNPQKEEDRRELANGFWSAAFNEAADMLAVEANHQRGLLKQNSTPAAASGNLPSRNLKT